MSVKDMYVVAIVSGSVISAFFSWGFKIHHTLNGKNTLKDPSATVVYVAQFLGLLNLVIWGGWVQFLGEYASQTSTMKSVHAAAGCILGFNLCLDAWLASLVAKSRYEHTEGLLKHSEKIGIDTDLSKLPTTEGTTAFEVVGGVALPNNQINTAFISASTNFLTKYPNVNDTMSVVDHANRINEDTREMHIFGNENARVLDLCNPTSELDNPHNLGYVVSQTGNESVNGGLYFRPRTATVSTVRDHVPTIAIIDRYIMGFGLGSGLWMNVGTLTWFLIFVYQIPSTQLLTRNVTSANCIMFSTLFAAAICSLASFQRHFIELILLFNAVAWGVMYTGAQIYNVPDYPLITASWNDTSTPWQPNPDYDSIDDSTTVYVSVCMSIAVQIAGIIFTVFMLYKVGACGRNPFKGGSVKTQSDLSYVNSSTPSESARLIEGRAGSMQFGHPRQRINRVGNELS